MTVIPHPAFANINMPMQEVSIVEAHLRTLERRFLATLSRTPPEFNNSAEKVESRKWDGAAWREQKQHAKAKTKQPDEKLTLLGMQRCVLSPLFHHSTTHNPAS